MERETLTFGWFLPTSGDSRALGDPKGHIPQSRELFDEIVGIVDDGGFSYMLMPVNASCWEATVTGAFYLARTKNVAPLVALSIVCAASAQDGRERVRQRANEHAKPGVERRIERRVERRTDRRRPESCRSTPPASRCECLRSLSRENLRSCHSPQCQTRLP